MASKDDQDVIDFLTLFAKLRAEIRDDPYDLEQKTGKDDALRRLCLAVNDAAAHLRSSESWGRRRFAHPVDPAFIEAWHVYEAEYSGPLAGVFFADMGWTSDRLGEPFKGSRVDLAWHYAEQEAREKTRAIGAVFVFAEEQVELLSEGDRPEEEVKEIENGILAWTQLTAECGVDVKGIFLRRRLIPFTLVPRHVPNHYSHLEKRSLLTNLQQAHEAFMLGVPFAALALMRSIAEAVLEKHYAAGKCHAATKGGLKQLIEGAKPFLPDQLVVRLQSLKNLADSILHMNPKRAKMPANIEREIVSLLLALRKLIETAPPAC